MALRYKVYGLWVDQHHRLSHVPHSSLYGGGVGENGRYGCQICPCAILFSPLLRMRIFLKTWKTTILHNIWYPHVATKLRSHLGHIATRKKNSQCWYLIAGQRREFCLDSRARLSTPRCQVWKSKLKTPWLASANMTHRHTNNDASQ